MSEGIFTLMVNTDNGTYQHPFHLGTIEYDAVLIAEEVHLHRKPKFGKILTVTLVRDGKAWDTFNGKEWVRSVLAPFN